MKAFVFPGQGAQFVGMGKDLYENSALAKELFEKANDILGYRITDIMFNGTDEDLRQTKVTQPAVFLHSVISALCMGDDFKPEMTAGHSLGGMNAKQKHNKVLKLAKGYRGARSKQYRVAKQSVMRALTSSYAGRKQRKRQFRQLCKCRRRSLCTCQL